MKSFLRLPALWFLCGLAFFGGLALAQSVQYQVVNSAGAPASPIGFDSKNNIYFPLGSHLLTFGSGGAPVMSSCGTSAAITGTDFSFKYTAGSDSTSCTLTFVKAYLTAPQCFIQENGGATEPTFTTSTTAISISVQAESAVYSGLCISVS